MTKPIFAMLFAGIAIQAQQFEVASVRQSAPEAILESFVPTLNVTPGATLRIRNRQLKELIQIAYGVGGRQVAGPQWLIDPQVARSEIPRFDIEAKVPADARREDGPVMLQNLLAERFHLRVCTPRKTADHHIRHRREQGRAEGQSERWRRVIRRRRLCQKSLRRQWRDDRRVPRHDGRAAGPAAADAFPGIFSRRAGRG